MSGAVGCASNRGLKISQTYSGYGVCLATALLRVHPLTQTGDIALAVRRPGLFPCGRGTSVHEWDTHFAKAMKSSLAFTSAMIMYLSLKGRCPCPPAGGSSYSPSVSKRGAMTPRAVLAGTTHGLKVVSRTPRWRYEWVLSLRKGHPTGDSTPSFTPVTRDIILVLRQGRSAKERENRQHSDAVVPAHLQSGLLLSPTLD